MPSAWMQKAVDEQEALAKKPAKLAKVASKQGEKINVAQKTRKKPAASPVEEEIVRLIFPCAKLLADRIEAEWHKRKLASKSETIRQLLGEALK